VDDGQLAAEQRARVLIDCQLTDAGWSVQDHKDLNLFAGQGVTVRESIMKPGHGRADYLLYVDQRAVGVIEAKPEGTPLSGVEWQSAIYAEGLSPEVRLKALTVEGRLPFVFEASGSETHLTNGFDPEPRARRVFAYPRPETLARLLRDAEADPDSPTWRAKVNRMPDLITAGLRPAQIEAVTGIERSLAEQRFDRSLVQMATGAGKTFTAVTSSYRLPSGSTPRCAASRSPTSTTRASTTSPRTLQLRWSTTRRCRRRPSIWSSSMRRIARSTGCGAGCWSTSTRMSSG